MPLCDCQADDTNGILRQVLSCEILLTLSSQTINQINGCDDAILMDSFSMHLILFLYELPQTGTTHKQQNYTT